MSARCAPVRADVTAAATTRPAEALNDGSRGKAISDFLRHFGSFGCRQICVRRTEAKPRPQEEVGHFVLETLATWRAEGLDAERLHKIATIAIHFDAYKLPGTVCMPACCRPWGGVEPPCPPGPGRPLTGRTAATGAAPRGSDWPSAGA